MAWTYPNFDINFEKGKDIILLTFYYFLFCSLENLTELYRIYGICVHAYTILIILFLNINIPECIADCVF